MKDLYSRKETLLERLRRIFTPQKRIENNKWKKAYLDQLEFCKTCPCREHSKTIQTYTSCNDCNSTKVCIHAPQWNEAVRYNCPFWIERKTK